MSQRRSAGTILLYLLVIIIALVSAILNTFLYVNPYTNGTYKLRVTSWDELIVSNNKSYRELFIVSPFNTSFVEKDFSSTLFMIDESTTRITQEKYFFNYNNSPYHVVQSTSNAFASIQIDTSWGKNPNLLTISQKFLINEPIRSPKTKIYSGIVVVNYNEANIETINEHTLSLNYTEGTDSYTISITGGEFDHIDKEWKLLVFEVLEEELIFQINCITQENAKIS